MKVLRSPLVSGDQPETRPVAPAGDCAAISRKGTLPPGGRMLTLLAAQPNQNAFEINRRPQATRSAHPGSGASLPALAGLGSVTPSSSGSTRGSPTNRRGEMTGDPRVKPEDDTTQTSQPERDPTP
ncbi:hypothetical protein GCM10011360_45170 [Primorskyibacter flagellatus]|uniref:Uncharacterized protein n=1 Tax=Primorskyibacter flagellatus TaxID=1387277 RepID=A0A917AIC3_9RHOB|nr:hypothetical protein GCM10011360_45170 [Primorskyibacter flagellatus]